MPHQRPRYGFTAEGLARWHRRWGVGLRVALAVGGTLLSLRLNGPLFPLVVGLLWGRALLPELRQLAAWAYQAIKGAALRDIEGRHFNFRGQTVRVHDDPEDGCRWVVLADIERCLGEPLGRLQREAKRQDSVREFGSQACVRDAALLDHLTQHRTNPRAVPLHRWVQREIWFPARGRNANGGAGSRQHPRMGFDRPSSTQ
jgi:hypothetical protein